MSKNYYSRIRNKLERIYTDIRFNAGLYRSLGNGKGILMYHGVDKTGSKKFNMRFVGSSEFERQLVYFKKNMNVLSVEDYFERKFVNDKINIAITFDDGYANNFKYALPILEKHQVPASLFITGFNPAGLDILWPDFLDIAGTLTDKDEVSIDGDLFNKVGNRWYLKKGGKSLHDIIKEKGAYEYKQKAMDAIQKIIPDFKNIEEYFDYWKLMSDEEIILASRSPYITIGSHAYYHNNLGNIPLEEAAAELSRSKIYLEDLIQKPVNSLSYPDGSYSRELISEASNMGFKYQLATRYYISPEDKSDNRIENRYGIFMTYSTANTLRAFEKNINSL